MEIIAPKKSLPQVILDEIALEGLEGITFDRLWWYISKATDLPLPLTSKLQQQIWDFIKRAEKHLSFFELPDERRMMEALNRFDNLDESLGLPKAVESNVGRYKYVAIEDGNIWGSCECYKERKAIPFEKLKNMSLENVIETWGGKFIIVASQEQRHEALTPSNRHFPKEISIVQYCVLEAIGRSRHSGEITSGSSSLLDYTKDPSDIFYIKNQLCRFGLIVSQSLLEKRGERLTATTLLTLPRFLVVRKNVLMQIIEKVFYLVKKSPDGCVPVTEVHKYFTNLGRIKAFKTLMLTHSFQRIFENRTISSNELTQPGKEAVAPKKKRNKNLKGRPMAVIYLRNPNMMFEELFMEYIAEEKNDNNDEFCDEKHCFVDMPLRDELYRTIARHGPAGCSQSEISKYMVVKPVGVRQLIKTFVKEGLIVSYKIDIGRQRISKYVAIEHASKITQNKTIIKSFHEIMCNPEPNISQLDGMTHGDVESISAEVRPYSYGINTSYIAITQKLVSRKTLIVETINERSVVSLSDISSIIQKKEKDDGWKDEMCNKSLSRILQSMIEANICRMYEIVLKFEEYTRSYRFITHPKIESNHQLVRNETFKLKNKLFMTIQERMQREKVQKEKTKKIVNPLESLKKGTVTPKFMLSRYMHELLFYVVIELNEYQTTLPLSEDLLQHWQQLEPSIQINEYKQQFEEEPQQPQIYTRDINWRTFIPPLQKYGDKPAGWVFFKDVMDRVPLSVLNHFFRLEKDTNELLQSYLTHPIRKHYMVHQLPIELRNALCHLQLTKVYLVMLKLLSQMGLLQVNEDGKPNNIFSLWVYLNRQAQIADTTSTEARYLHVNPDREYPVTRHTFATMEDVYQYWTQLQRVCVYTKLGFRRGSKLVIGRNEMKFLPSVNFDEAPLHDNGETPGDHMGAAGLSTVLFAHTFRNWSWVRQTVHRVTPRARTDRHFGVPPGMKRKSKVKVRVTTPHVTVRAKSLGASTATKSEHAAAQKKKHSVRDAIDRDALKNMSTLRVTWLPQETEMLRIARAVYLYVSAPVPVFGLVTLGRICRDIIRRTLGVRNKTSQAVMRRIQFISRHQHVLPQVPMWVNILQTNEFMQRKYGDRFLTRLKRDYPHRVEYNEAVAKHFVCIMLHLYKIIHGANAKDSGQINSQFILPDTIDEFRRRFDQGPLPNDDQGLFYANPSDEADVQVTMAINVLHSLLCCTVDKTSYSLQTFDIFRSLSEEVLQRAFHKARNDAMVVSLRRKSLPAQPLQLSAPSYVLSNRYRLRLTFLKITYRVYEMIHCFSETAYASFFAEIPQSGTKQIVELKTPQIGQLMFIGEGLACGYWSAQVKLPSNILTVDMEQPQAMSQADRIMDHFQYTLENAPETEYAKNLEIESNERKVRVKFHPANLCYKIHYSPYDVIAKLPIRMLHFFCALDHLGQEVDINFSRLQHKDDELGFVVMECPFNCIMKNANYINAIERIVQEQRSILNQLNELPVEDLLDLAASEDKIVVRPSNLLTLVQMLESLLREKELAFESKDIGKVSSTLRRNKQIDWQQVCVEILEFGARNEDDIEPTEEYEPTLNKEERVLRAQDVFVVNLPTIQLSASAKLRDAEKIVHNNLLMPRVLLEADLQREEILQKIIKASFWTYTENTLEMFKPKLPALGFNAMEQQHLEELHNFIQSRNLGVTVADLLQEFPYEKFLERALRVLVEFQLVKRVGVETFMYVHKSHIRPWVVHTFHIKRLDRESIGSTDAAAKRKYAEEAEQSDGDNELEPVASSSKKAKLSETTEQSNTNVKTGKRAHKPVKQFGSKEKVAKSETGDVAKDIIVMRPQPWLRLNGSLNRRVLDRWLGSILTECAARCGCTVNEICLRFPYMLPVDVMFLLEILRDLKCIEMLQMCPVEVDLFAECEDFKESPAGDLYDPERTYIEATTDALIRMSTFIGHKKYKAEFV